MARFNRYGAATLLCLVAPFPSFAAPITFANPGGLSETPVSAASPLPISGSISASLTFPTIGATAPSTADYIAAAKAGVLTGLTMDGSSNLNINCAAGCTAGPVTAAGSSASTAAAIQGVTGGIAVPVSGTLTVNTITGFATSNLQPAINADLGSQVHVMNFPTTQATNVTQFGGSATVTGTGVGGAGIPRVTVSNDSAVGLVASGLAVTSSTINSKQRLDVTLASGATVGAAVPTFTDVIGGTDGANARQFLTDTTGRQIISQAASTPVNATLQAAATTAVVGAVLNVAGMSAALLTVNLSAAVGATVVFEGTQDGTNYSAINGVQLGTTTIASSVTGTAITLWEMPVGGMTSVRARISAITSGNVTVTGTAVPVAYNAKIVKAVIDQTTPGTTNGVQVNAALPAGANLIGSVGSVINAPQVVGGSAFAYTTGTVFGAPMSFTGQPTTGFLQDIAFVLSSGTFATGSIDLVLFNAAPAGSYTDTAAFALSASDTGKVIGVVNASTITSMGGILSLVEVLNVGKPYVLAASGTTIYAVAVLRGAVTLSTVNHITVNLGVIK